MNTISNKSPRSRKSKKTEVASNINNAELFEALKELADDKRLNQEALLKTMIEPITLAVKLAVKKDNPGVSDDDIRVDIDQAKDRFEVFILMTVTEAENIENPAIQITPEEVKKYSSILKVGDIYQKRVDTKYLKRTSASSGKQRIHQGVRAAEKSRVTRHWEKLFGTVISVPVVSINEKGDAIVIVNEREAKVARHELIPFEIINPGDIIKVYVKGATESEHRMQLKLSRTAPELLKILFETEIPEVMDGTILIKSVSRVPGIRSKVAVYSKNENVDPIGSCIGPAKSRINIITNQIAGEKIDLILWDSDPAAFIIKAFQPAKINSVSIIPNEDPNILEARVVVPDDQFSLAIGIKGQNAKLAALLTGYSIDIAPESGIYLPPPDSKIENTENTENTEIKVEGDEIKNEN